MFRRYPLVACALLLTFGMVRAAPAAPYYFTTLAPSSTGTDAIPTVFNTVGGQIEVGGSAKYGAPALRGMAATWSNLGAGATVAGAAVPISDVSGAAENDRVFGIDSNGDLAGYSRTTSGTFFPWFLPAGSSSATPLPALASGDAQVAVYGMNNSQQVVGVDGATVSTGQAVTWTQTGGTWGVATLPGLAAGSYGEASAISNSGVVAGWSNTVTGALTESNPGYQDAVTWTNTGSGWVVNDLVNRNVYTTGAFGATAVNSAGVSVGYGFYGGIDVHDSSTPVEFTSNGIPIVLGNLGATGANGVYPSTYDSALGINDSGVVVGTATTSSGVLDAFIYGLGANNTMQDMNTVFASYIPAGWSLSAATAIDDNGDIVGYGSNGSSGNQGFLLAPAIPGDANLDGKVDINDLTVVLAHYNQTGMSWSQGEFTGDGTVDINDLTIVLAHYNQSFGASVAGNVSAVPEPCALVLLAIGAAGLLGLVWRRRM